MNFIEQALKKLVDNFEPVAPGQFQSLTYPEKCQLALRLFAESHDAGRELPDYMAAMANMIALLAPFVVPSRPDRIIRSVSLATEQPLIADLSGTGLPSNINADYFNQHREFDSWFIQLPDCCFQYTDSIWLSGLFYIPPSGITAIICQRDSSEYLYGIEWGGRIQTVPSSALNIDSQAMERARTLAQLVILHYDSKRQQKHEFVERKTYPRNSEASPKKRGKRNLKYSLFRTINIDYQGDYQRSGIPSGVTRRPLEHAFTVRGHFRWQAYGKKFSKHKLLWIDSHTRGSGDLDTRATKITL